MIEVFLLCALLWLGLFLEHSLGVYGLLTVLVLMGSGMVGDGVRKWIVMIHIIIVSICADAVFGRTPGMTTLIFGLILIMWSFVARFSRARFFAFMALGVLVFVLLYPEREHFIRFMIVYIVMWIAMKGVHMQTATQEIMLK